MAQLSDLLVAGSARILGKLYCQDIDEIVQVKTVSIPASGWSSTAPYTQTVSVSGITSTDAPLIYVNTTGSTSLTNERDMKKQYDYISSAVSGDGNIKFTAKYTKPTINLSVYVKGK